MKLVPLSYNLRSLWVKRSSTLLTMSSIAATVLVLAGLLALQQGFATLFSSDGREDLAVILRQGATSEGQSGFQRDRVDVMVKESSEFALGADGQPLASGELFLAVRRFKLDGGESNVSIRGVQPRSFVIHGDALRFVEGRRPEAGADEVAVGSALPGRFRDCEVGDVLVLNTTPFRVVGVFEGKGAFESEIWGDADRLMQALERPVFNRVIGVLADGADIEAFSARLEADKRGPAQAQTEKAYLMSQTQALSTLFISLGGFLASIMGIGAVFTGTNSMLSAVASRTHEIGVLLSVGFRPAAVFLSFLFESVLLGLLGGLVGCVLALPLQGIRTGTMNPQTFTEAGFAFSITPTVLVAAVLFAMLLGLFGGAIPAWRASRLRPTEALRRG